MDISENPPSSPHFNCSWDDGNADVSIPFDLDTNQEVTDAEYKYHIYHQFAQAGEYNVSCTLFNKVSSKSITKLVVSNYSTNPLDIIIPSFTFADYHI